MSSIPFKFTNHPYTQNIFGKIGNWLSELIAQPIGDLFASLGGYVVGSFELLTSIILLLPAILWLVSRIRGQANIGVRRRFHMLGGLLCAAVMGGAVFFHLFTPLGVEVVFEGQSDGGALFYTALSVFILGIVLFLLNRKPIS